MLLLHCISFMRLLIIAPYYRPMMLVLLSLCMRAIASDAAFLTPQHHRFAYSREGERYLSAGRRKLLFPKIRTDSTTIDNNKSKRLSTTIRYSSPSSSSYSFGTIPDDAEVLSEDPLVYVLPNLLSKEECEAYIDRVQDLEQEGRNLTVSNPPEVSLVVAKLWPLPILSFGAGIPNLIRLLQEQPNEVSTDQILATILPPILIAFLTSLILAYGIILPLIQKFSSSSSRTSVAMALNLDNDVPFVQPLVNRISAYTGHPWEAWEAPVATKYDPGAVFALHGDASPTKGSEWKDLGGQRVVTCICYLNTLAEDGGGCTYFDKLQIEVKPTQGQGLFFFPADFASLQADDRTTHESQPVTSEQEKWIVQMFGRIGPRVPPPLGLPDSFSDHNHSTLG